MYKFIFLVLLVGVSFNKQEATTSKGEKVFLFDDGTWKYAKDFINNDNFKTQIKKIHSIRHWYSMTINNECIIEFRNYLDGYYDNQDFDIEFTILLFNEEMKKLEEYNLYINSLDGEKFNHLKYTWNKLSDELIKIQTWINNNKSNLRYAYGRFSYHQISKYDDAFSNAYEDLRDMGESSVPLKMFNPDKILEICILNGSNIQEIAKRYKKLIMLNDHHHRIYDVRKIGNSDKLENESRIIIHSKNAKQSISEINNLKDLLGINETNVIDNIKNNPDYDVTVIIGKDYKLLESYEEAFSPEINIYIRD